MLCRPQCEMDKFTRINAYKQSTNTTSLPSAFCNWTSTHTHRESTNIHNCQMELDLILPLLMKIGSVTRTNHCHFTSLYTVYLCVCVRLHWTSCSMELYYSCYRVASIWAIANDAEMSGKNKYIYTSVSRFFFALSHSLSFLLLLHIVFCERVECFGTDLCSPVIWFKPSQKNH